MDLEKRKCLVQTCDLRETGRSGYQGFKDKQVKPPGIDITAEEQSKGRKEGEVPQGTDAPTVTREVGTLSCGLVCYSWKGTGGPASIPL